MRKDKTRVKKAMDIALEQLDYIIDYEVTFDGISGSDISNAVFAAAVSAAREKEEIVSTEKFEAAIQRMISVKKANMQQGNETITTKMITEEEMRIKLGQEEEK